MVAHSIAIAIFVLLGSLSFLILPAGAEGPADKLAQVPEGAIRIAGETGAASIYGYPGDKTAGGKITANGETFSATDMSAAHKSIPFGTNVRVTNLVNGLSAIVRINNRGPFVKGRIIDLTPAAAEALGFSVDKEGLAPVTLTVLAD